MATHFLRPMYWAEQLILILPSLVAGDEIRPVSVPSKLAIELLLQEWGVGNGVTVLAPFEFRTSGCLRCGGDLYGPFCHHCTGRLHKQTCAKLWEGIAPGSNVDYLVRCGLTDHPDNPCNCGGDELEHSVRHAKDLV